MTAAISALASLPPRTPLVILGIVLLVWAGRLLLMRPVPAEGADSVGVAERRSMRGALVRCSARVCRRDDMLLHRRSDSHSLAMRLAVAPQSWPARGVALAMAGDDAQIDLADAMAGVRLICAVGGAFVTGASCLAADPVVAVIGAAAGGLAGLSLPDVFLRRAARRALASGRRSAARAGDLLAAAATTGLPLRDALELTAGHAPPAVAAAFRAASVRLSTGAAPLEALAVEAERHHLPILADIGEAADRQRRLGIPLGPELRQIAARHRAQDRADLLAHAARRGPLATLVVALVIAPVCVAALTACLVGGLIEGGGLGLR